MDQKALVIAPHPDDESLGCGGWIARQRRAGQPVHVVFLTDGEASHAGHPTVSPGMLAARRTTEAVEAQQVLRVGPEAVHFLHAPDGRLDKLSAAESAMLVSRLADVLSRVQPGEVLLPCRRDGSSEHEAGFLLARAALREAGITPVLREFPVWAWWSPRLLAPHAFGKNRVLRCGFRAEYKIKARAIASYHSQIQPIPPWTEPILSRQFVSFFLQHEEFFFEIE